MLPLSAHVMIVEDDHSARASLRQVLEHSGCQVTALPDGESACAYLRTQAAASLDVVITDLLLHEIDGLHVLEAARQSPAAPEVIMLTGYGTLSTAIGALRAGAYDYLLKPYRPQDLLDRLRGALQRRTDARRRSQVIDTITRTLDQLQRQAIAIDGAVGNGHSSEVAERPTGLQISFGGLRLDTSRQMASLYERELALTPIEYVLLHSMILAAGEVCQYRELAVSSHNLTLSDTEAGHLLKPHIYNLRQKIAPVQIVNVRGVGYRLRSAP